MNSQPQIRKITFSNLASRIELTLTKANTNLYSAEILNGIKISKTGHYAKLHHREINDEGNIPITETYLNSIENELSSQKLRFSKIEILPHSNNDINYNTSNIKNLQMTSNDLSQIEIMFRILNRAYKSNNSTNQYLEVIVHNSKFFDPQTFDSNSAKNIHPSSSNLVINQMSENMDEKYGQQSSSILQSSYLDSKNMIQNNERICVYELPTIYCSSDESSSKRSSKCSENSDPSFNFNDYKTSDKSSMDLAITELSMDSFGKVLKYGLLIKQGHIRKNFKKRLFILTDDGYMRYYHDKTHKLLSKINLSSVEFVSIQTENSIQKKTRNVFTVKIPGREYVFAAPTDAERKEWIAIIQHSMICCKNKINFNSNSELTSLQSWNDRKQTSVSYNKRTNRHELLMNVSAIQWKELSNVSTFADLQELLEDVVNLQLQAPDKLKLVVISQLYVQPLDDSQNMNVDWTSILNRIQAFFDKAHGNIIMQGFLFKKLQWRKWSTRYVILRLDLKLEWYLTKHAQKCRGFLDLRGLIGVRKIVGGGEYDMVEEESNFLFEVETKERTVLFACDTIEELQTWTDNIQKYSIYSKPERGISGSSSLTSDDMEFVIYESSVQKRKPKMIEPVIF